MKARLKLIAIAHLLAGIGLSASAQSTAFTYQGRLNSGANPANGSYDLTFSLFSTAGGAGQVGGTVTNSTVVSNGLFAVALDFGGQFPGADRWLEIAVRTNGGGGFTALAPRQRLTPAPYAITAANLSGAVSVAQLPAGVITNGASGVNFAGSFTGNGAGLTNVAGWTITTNSVSADDTNVLTVTGETLYGWNGNYHWSAAANGWTNAAVAAPQVVLLGFDSVMGWFGLFTNRIAWRNAYDNFDSCCGYKFGSGDFDQTKYYNLPYMNATQPDDTVSAVAVVFASYYYYSNTINTASFVIAGNGANLSNVVAKAVASGGGGIGNTFTNPVFKMSTAPRSTAYIIVTNRTLLLPGLPAQSNSLCLYSVVDPLNTQMSSIGFLDGALVGSLVGRYAGFSWFPYHTGTEMEMTIDSPGSLALGWANESLPGVALQPNRSLQIGINPSEFGRLENIYIEGNFNSYANPNMGYAIPLSFNSAYKSNGVYINQLMTLWAHATTTNGQSRLSLYDNWDQSATPDLKSHDFSKSVLRAEFITKSAGAGGGLDVYGRLWSTNFVGNGSGLTNLSFTGNTNAVPPASTTVVKAWLNFTNVTGGVFKMPLYQ